jgi:hypothetical protein
LVHNPSQEVLPRDVKCWIHKWEWPSS